MCFFLLVSGVHRVADVSAAPLCLSGRHPRTGAFLAAGAAGGPVLRGSAGDAGGAQLAAAAALRGLAALSALGRGDCDSWGRGGGVWGWGGGGGEKM